MEVESCDAATAATRKKALKGSSKSFHLITAVETESFC